MSQGLSPVSLIVCTLLLVAGTQPALHAQETWMAEPVNYRTAAADNPITRLQEQLQQDRTELEFHAAYGFLPSLLQQLQIPIDSQTLVFSRTSLQLRRISPATPRAIYFNDDIYVGFTVGGDVLEISVADPGLGAVFYTLSQRQQEPIFQRTADECIACHSSSRTEGVPGHLMRSLQTANDGQPLFSAGSQNVNHTTPFAQRFGGWYVTGTHGTQRHQGNVFAVDRNTPNVDDDSGLNRTELHDLFRTDRYLSPHSDLVALLVLGHQVLVHNRLTKASFTTREALNYQTALNEALDNPPGTLLDSTTRRIASAGEQLVEALLLAQEAPLTEPVHGTSGFEQTYSARGPQDDQGRSLFQLDLQQRLFRYPCSPLIYSTAFRQLPDEIRLWTIQRISQILAGSADDPRQRYTHLSPADRQAIAEILTATHPDFRTAAIAP